MMGILMPETCLATQHRINKCVVSSWSFTLPNFTMHGHMNINRIAFECRYNLSSSCPVVRNSDGIFKDIGSPHMRGRTVKTQENSQSKTVSGQISEFGTSTQCRGAVHPRPRRSVHWDTNPVIWNTNTEHFGRYLVTIHGKSV
jgi:hypothetical protein